MVSIPRVVIAAPASGHGKTSVATGLLAALRARGLTVSPHKIGPDYIDPGYHALAAGRPGRNLDPWLVGEQRIPALLAHGAATPRQADIAIVEGVMGLFDGAVGQGSFASTAHVAQLIDAPILLVVDAAAVGRSVAALVHGFATFDPQVRIAGVIFNRVGSPRHHQILAEAMAETGIPVVGAVRRQDALMTPSRHLGLIPAAERTAEASATVAALGDVIAACVDLDAVLRIARTAPDLDVAPHDFAVADTVPDGLRPRIAIAGGAAFTFGYAEQAELLAAHGAEVVTFDPLRDEQLPENVHGLVIGGGFPETHADQLSANAPMRSSVAAAINAGVPVAAECAGLLYLAATLDAHPMCGVLDVDAVMTDRLTLGYREAVATGDSVLTRAGTRVRGHEFHRTACGRPVGTPSAWQWRVGQDHVQDGVAHRNIHASYLHLHWAGDETIPARFVDACRTAAQPR